VGLADQKARYVFPCLGPGVTTVSREIREPFVFLKVCASPTEVGAILEEGWAVRPVSYFMALDGLRSPPAKTSPIYRLGTRQLPGGFSAEILVGDDSVAATGSVIVVGDVAVFDRIETRPNHRRQGLGRAIMSELSTLARGVGAQRGVLVATSDGQALYATMGWQVRSAYTTAVRE
jgi:GNAT superfamily N-acetyltransferase